MIGKTLKRPIDFYFRLFLEFPFRLYTNHSTGVLIAYGSPILAVAGPCDNDAPGILLTIFILAWAILNMTLQTEKFNMAQVILSIQIVWSCECIFHSNKDTFFDIHIWDIYEGATICIFKSPYMTLVFKTWRWPKFLSRSHFALA